MRATFCWPEISGYMAACWRALLAERGIETFVLGHRSGVKGAGAAFGDAVMASIPNRLLDMAEREDDALVASLVVESKPDVIVLPGWGVPVYSRLIKHPALSGKRFVMFMDTPLRNTWRQKLARLRIGGYLDRMDAVIVTGERSWQFARTLLKIPEHKLRRGAYGIDYDAFAPSHAMRTARPDGWPRRFLFMGRYAEVKGIDTLIEAYKTYRTAEKNPWPLTCHGTGPLASAVMGEGVTDAGFAQPADQPRILAEHGALVLPSRFDPWPLVVVEACAAGLPVICTEACGSSVELVRPYFNGVAVPANDAQALARAMRWTQNNYAELSEMGRRGQHLAAAYSAQMWARRWARTFFDVCGNGD